MNLKSRISHFQVLTVKIDNLVSNKMNRLLKLEIHPSQYYLDS